MAGQPPIVPGTRRPDGSLVALRGEPIPPSAKPATAAAILRPGIQQFPTRFRPIRTPVLVTNSSAPGRDDDPDVSYFPRGTRHLRGPGEHLSLQHQWPDDQPIAATARHVQPRDRVDAYIWAVLRARNAFTFIRDDFPHLVVPRHMATRTTSSRSVSMR